MFVVRRPRNPALTPFVETLWITQGQLAHDFERVLPTGRAQLLINLHEDRFADYALDGSVTGTIAGAALTGPQTRSRVIDTCSQQSICGVSFFVGGARSFIKAPMSEITETIVDLSNIWGRKGSILRERLLEKKNPSEQIDVLEAALTDQLRTDARADRALDLARRMLTDGATVASVSDRLGVSDRTLIARFRDRTGLTPKQFARIERFQQVVQSIDRVTSWSDLAISHGYSDQAHMIRDFKEFSGTTPTAYHARSIDQKNHSAIAL